MEPFLILNGRKLNKNEIENFVQQKFLWKPYSGSIFSNVKKTVNQRKGAYFVRVFTSSLLFFSIYLDFLTILELLMKKEN